MPRLTPTDRAGAGVLTNASMIRALLILAIALTPTVIVAGPVYGFDIPKLILIAVLSTAMAVLSLRELPAFWRRSSTAMRVMLVSSAAFAAWMLVATLLSGTSRLSVLGPDGRFVGTVATFFPVVLVVAVPIAADTIRRLDTGVRWLAVVLGAISAYAVVQFLGLDPMPWAVPFGGRPVATFGNPNFVGAALCLTMPLALWLWFRRPPLRWASGALIALGVFALWASDARLGWIAATAGAMAFAAVYVPTHWQRVQGWFIAALAVAAPIAGLAAVGVGIAIQDPTGLARLAYWRAAVPMWLDNPAFGVGLGRFEVFHRAYRPPESVIEVGRDIPVDSSHAWLIDLAATTGTPGAVLWLAVLVGVGLVLREAWLRSESDERPLVAALAGMVTAHGVQSSISVPTVVPVWLGWLIIGGVLALGMVVGTSPRSMGPVTAGRRRRRGKRTITIDPQTLITGLLAALAALLIAVPGLDVWNASNDIGAATSLRRAGQPGEALPRFQRAVQDTPWWPEPWRELVGTALEAGDQEVARAAREPAIAADDRNRNTVRVMIDAATRLDGIDAAEPWIRRLRELDPVGLETHLTVATWALQVGEEQLAREALEIVELTIDPSLDYWPQYEDLRRQVDG